ncbi:triosephosphate isomerase [Holotrichia oblita]|nr:triosephosphate isomerase [Holotrichia oblita]
MHAASWQSEVVITPTFLSLETASRKITPNVKLGAQDVSHLGMGAYCGEIPASLLKALGVKYCIVGHVERRGLGETNDRINLKVKNCLAYGIIPILCIGETLSEYEGDKTRVVIEKQLKECLVGVSGVENIVIAYQPIWSIGTGNQVPTEYIGIIADFIRKTVKKITGNALSANFTLLYGGGPITAQTAKMFLETPDIDGLMVGGTSLKPSSLSEIVNTKFQIKKSYLE